MSPKELFQKCLDIADHCLSHVDEKQFSNPTPCSEWNLKALLNHMVYEVLWVPDLLMGKTVADVGSKYDGDILGTDMHQAWQKASQQARQAVDNLDDLDRIVHLSYGDVPARNYIAEIAGDVLVHSWDVDQSIHCSLILDEKILEVIYQGVLPRQNEFAASGLFGSQVNVDDNASLQTKLLALFGRHDRKTN